MSLSFHASAPGSLMLLGEHAVLHGSRALVCAVDRRMHAQLTPREDDFVRIESVLGSCQGTLARLPDPPSLRFVAAAIRSQRRLLKRGFDLAIESEFSHQVGLGSSSAVTVAILAVIQASLGKPLARRQLFDDAVAVVRKIQGLGSGADVAATVYGGIIEYRMRPLLIRPLGKEHPLTVMYSGSKEPTVKVVRQVEARRRAHPALFRHVYAAMNESVVQAVAAIRRGSWKRAGEILDFNHGLMDAIGVSTEQLTAIACALRADPGICGAKISGSGLGDCVIGLGKAHRARWPYTVVPVTMSPHGVRIENGR